jgi:xanthine dehydrogenase molybdopterin-binding subunit B
VNFTFPCGAHIAEVEIDPDTGTVELLRYIAVDDVGTVINPMIVEGQIHGGVAQGVGQALFEDCVYDEESGQLLSGSFMDYCMPLADNLPDMTVETHVTPCTHNALGVTEPGTGISNLQAVTMELMLTLGLVSTILGTASESQNIGGLSAVGVGGYIVLAGLWSSPISGAS